MHPITKSVFNRDLFEVFINKKIALIMFLGFSSGLPLALSGGTLQAWIATTPASIISIGLLGLVGLPYTLKFLWAPVLDRFKLSTLGRRRGWMIFTQILLTITMLLMGLTNPQSGLIFLAVLAFCLAFLSASQDIAFDAFRTDSLNRNERGPGQRCQF